MDYLQYIKTAYRQPATNQCFLVSGADRTVRDAVQNNVIRNAENKIIFVIDNDNSQGTDATISTGCGNCIDALSGDVNLLCEDLLEMSSVQNISRFRTMLCDLGFDPLKAIKVVQYLSFIKETEHRLGNDSILSLETLKEYAGVILVKQKLESLLKTDQITPPSYEYLIGRYSEISSAAADFENVLLLIAPFWGARLPSAGMTIKLKFADFRHDQLQQKLMAKFFISYMKQEQAVQDAMVVLIFDDGNGDADFLVNIIKNIPEKTEVHMFSRDAFAFDDTTLTVLFNRFPIRVYSRHDNMKSSAKIENLCGEIDVVKKAFSTSVDRRLRNNSAWDMLLGTNHTDTEIYNAPTRQYRFRKEQINSLCEGTGIVEYMGRKILFSFKK